MEEKTRIFLFGSSTLFALPSALEEQLYNLYINNKDNIEFIVGDCKGADSAFHKALSAIGAGSNTTIYCMDKPRNNLFDFKVRSFMTSYDQSKQEVYLLNADGGVEFTFENVENPTLIYSDRRYYEFKDRQMINDCTFGVSLWDGKTKGTSKAIDLLSIRDKKTYVFKCS